MYSIRYFAIVGGTGGTETQVGTYRISGLVGLDRISSKALIYKWTEMGKFVMQWGTRGLGHMPYVQELVMLSCYFIL